MHTVFACLTPPGKAAIAVLAVRGPKAWQIARQLFRPAKGALPDHATPMRFWFGRISADAGDEVFLAVPADDHVEIHCHGGMEVVRMIEELFVENGATRVSWQQFSEPSNPFQELLANAPTTRTAAILLDQTHGAWEQVVKWIENGDSQALARLESLISLGQHLVPPWKIAIAGAPNVGKSSLVNALAGYARSVVAPTPGTTRDIVGVRLAIDGWPVEIIDTAGIRAAAGNLESQGIERAKTAAADADLRLWVVDGSVEPILPDDVDRWILVINKSDLPAGWDWEKAPGALRVSAKTRAGLENLCAALSRRLVPSPPERHEAVPCLPEQAAWVRSLCARCEKLA